MKTYLMALLACAMALGAAAEDPAAPAAACPADAEVQAWQASKALEWVVQQDDLDRDAGTAIALANACPGRPFVQYFSARSFFFILRKLGDPNEQFRYLTAATNALRAYDIVGPEDRIWQPGLKAEDGSDIRVDTLSGAKSLLADNLAPLVVRFEAGGMFHPFLSPESLQPGSPCPWKTPDLAVAEGAGYPEGFDQIGPYLYANGQLPNIVGAAGRIVFLKTACPAAQTGLTAGLAKLYAHAAHGADGIGDKAHAAIYAKEAIAEYEAYLPDIAGKESTGSMVAATQLELKDLKTLVPDGDAP